MPGPRRLDGRTRMTEVFSSHTSTAQIKLGADRPAFDIGVRTATTRLWHSHLAKAKPLDRRSSAGGSRAVDKRTRPEAGIMTKRRVYNIVTQHCQINYAW